MSGDVIGMRKNLIKANTEESGEGEATSLAEPESLMQLLNEAKWSTALAIAKANR